MRYRIGLIILMIFGSLQGCTTTPRENTASEVASAKLVLGQISNALGDAYPTGSANFEMGKLEDGNAVLLVEVNGRPLGAAFWVHGTTVHAVNGAARALNGTLPPAPDKITEKRVRKTVY